MHQFDGANAPGFAKKQRYTLRMKFETLKFLRPLFALGIASITLGGLFGACTTVHQTKLSNDLTRPEVDRVSRERVRIRWPASFTTGPVLIYAGPTPDAIDRSAPLAKKSGGFAYLTTASHPDVKINHRLYYELFAVNSGESIVTAERRLPLDGADNFRDLGGYRTTDRRFVRWGVLFRSNDLADFTDDDLDYLSEIDIRLQCDLRSDHEREKRPNRPLRGTTAEVLEFPIRQVSMNPSEIQEAIRTGNIGDLGIRDIMLATYRSFPVDHLDRWQRIFRRLENPDSLPFLVHCTAGKDRTGFISALVLLALGVPEQTVYEDYLATNQYRASYNNMILRWAPLYSLFRTDEKDLRPLLDARAEYLEASLQEIKNRWGSVDVYLEDAIGLTDEKREALRANLLTTPRLQSVKNTAPAGNAMFSERMTPSHEPAVPINRMAQPSDS